jgi:hypothetical protein
MKEFNKNRYPDLQSLLDAYEVNIPREVRQANFDLIYGTGNKLNPSKRYARNYVKQSKTKFFK